MTDGVTLRVGQEINSFCGGHFGRDFLDYPARVEAIGFDWVVVRDARGKVYFATAVNIVHDIEWFIDHASIFP